MFQVERSSNVSDHELMTPVSRPFKRSEFFQAFKLQGRWINHEFEVAGALEKIPEAVKSQPRDAAHRRSEHDSQVLPIIDQLSFYVNTPSQLWGLKVKISLSTKTALTIGLFKLMISYTPH